MLANIDFLMATAVQVTKMPLCLLVWGNCLSNRLLAWFNVLQEPFLHSQLWGISGIFATRGETRGVLSGEQHDLSHGRGVDSMHSSSVQQTDLQHVSLICKCQSGVVCIAVLEPPATPSFLRHVSSSRTLEPCLIFLSSLSQELKVSWPWHFL